MAWRRGRQLLRLLFFNDRLGGHLGLGHASTLVGHQQRQPTNDLIGVEIDQVKLIGYFSCSFSLPEQSPERDGTAANMLVGLAIPRFDLQSPSVQIVRKLNVLQVVSGRGRVHVELLFNCAFKNLVERGGVL